MNACTNAIIDMVEILDLVDENDNVIGTLSRNEIYENNLKNYRVVNLFIVNSEGDLWVPRRSAKKKLFPLALDFSVGGHVQAGETYLQALIREVQEEVGISVRESDVVEICRYFPSEGLSSFGALYLLFSNATPKFAEDEFSEAEWMEPEVLLRRIEEGDRVKDDLRQLCIKTLDFILQRPHLRESALNKR